MVKYGRHGHQGSLNNLKNEKGYALLLVLLFITMSSIVFITLMGMTVNSQKGVGISRNYIKEKVAAENIINEALAFIDIGVDDLNDDIENRSIIPANLLSRLIGILDNAELLGGGKYDISHSVVKNGEGDVYLLNVTISTAVDENKKLTKTITMSTVAEVFQYSIYSGNNLTFNGSSYIEGDIYVSNDIITSNEGKFILGREKYVDTTYPAIKGSLTVKGDFYREDQYHRFEPTIENLNKHFSIAPRLRDTTLSFEQLNVRSIINEKSQIPSSTPVHTKTIWRWGRYIQVPDNLNVRNNMVINGDLKIEGDLVIDNDAKLTINGNLYVTGDADLSGELVINGVGNFLYIGDEADISRFTLDGQIFIDGRADIRNDLNTNGTIYANDEITVEDLSNNSGGTLVLISDDEIQVANNNEFNEEPKIINAYFYSNETLEIYGIGSHLKINGGIYGNPIILNAVKGRTEKSRFQGSFNSGGLFFEDRQSELDPTKSRLSIIFKKELILNPPKGIPTIKKVIVKEIDSTFQ